MTNTFDPTHPAYLDEADVRAELTRVFDVCGGCRQCLDLCPSFPTLFDMIDRQENRDAGLLTPADQDRVVDECFHCSKCIVSCPYTPERHELSIDVPRLMLRARAMQHRHGHSSERSKDAAQLIGHSASVGRFATLFSPLVNRILTAAPGSPVRRLVAKFTGHSAQRVLPPYASRTFSTWFSQRQSPPVAGRRGRVTVLPTCLVEYHEPQIGTQLIESYERNGIDCATSAAGCCGAPSLHAGDIGRFTKIATRNVAALAAEIRAGTDIVVPQPMCRVVLQQRYQDHVADGPTRADAALVAAHTFDASEYLAKLDPHH